MLHQAKILDTNTFDQLVDRSANIILETNPVLSSQMGKVIHNNIWPDISTNGINKDIEILEAIKEKLTDLSGQQLTEKVEKDRELLRWFVEMNLFELKDLELWKSSPYLSSTLTSGINVLIQKNHPDKKSRVNSIISRLASIKPLITGEQERISQPIELWIEAEINSLDALIDFINSLPNIFDEISHNDEFEDLLYEDLCDMVAKSIDELQKHKEWLGRLEGDEEIPTTADTYKRLLQKRKIGYTPQELEDLGNEYLEKTSNQLQELVEDLPGENIEEVRENIRSDHPPTFDEVVDHYKELASKAKQLIIDEDLLTLPEEELKVVFTPPPMRRFLSIAAAGSAGRFDPEQIGYFFTTPHNDDDMLKEHSYAYMPLLMSHESYPGHHVHGACKNQHPSLVRTSIFSSSSPNTGLMYSPKLADITEGWGLYCEKMMYDAGFENNPDNPDLKQKFLQINAKRWRAARVVIDVNLHSGKMSYDEAVDFLVEKTGYNRTTAESEVLMYSKSPGYFSSYLLGYHLISNLSEEVEKDISLKKFHDEILYAGNVPWWFIREKFSDL